MWFSRTRFCVVCGTTSLLFCNLIVIESQPLRLAGKYDFSPERHSIDAMLDPLTHWCYSTCNPKPCGIFTTRLFHHPAFFIVSIKMRSLLAVNKMNLWVCAPIVIHTAHSAACLVIMNMVYVVQQIIHESDPDTKFVVPMVLETLVHACHYCIKKNPVTTLSAEFRTPIWLASVTQKGKPCAANLESWELHQFLTFSS